MSGVQIVIPMAGSGQRFRDAGYAVPKPFIPVHGTPMIARVLENLACEGASYTLVARREDEAALAALNTPKRFNTVLLDAPTEGAACTVLLAARSLDRNAPLLVANADQLVDVRLEDFVSAMGDRDGMIMTFSEPSRDPKWSYVRCNDAGIVVETKEKTAISDMATVGLYLFARTGDFIGAAEAMIAADERVHGEFYLCPVYNHLIKKGQKIGAYPIAREAMHGLGTPEDLARYLGSS